jgi:CheY-like chemotaxis protein
MNKVLIVDDDLFYQKIYKRKFELAGFEAEVAGDGEEGLDKMKTFKPELVFMDLVMPRMDGFEAIEKAKADSALKNIPIVVLTNLSSPDDAKIALEKGALEIVVKSNVNPEEVIEKAKNILKRYT